MKIVATTTRHRDAASAADPSFEKYVSAATLENDVQCSPYTLQAAHIVAASEISGRARDDVRGAPKNCTPQTRGPALRR